MPHTGKTTIQRIISPLSSHYYLTKANQIIGNQRKAELIEQKEKAYENMWIAAPKAEQTQNCAEYTLYNKKWRESTKMETLHSGRLSAIMAPFQKEVTQMDESGLPMILTPKDISGILGISRNKAYEVIHSAGFPGFKVGKQYRIYRDKFLIWLGEVKEIA